MLKNKSLKTIIGSIIVIVCFFFILKFFFVNLHKVDFEKIKFDPLYLIIWLLIWAPVVLLNGLIWKISLNYIGEKLSFIKSLEVISLSFLPRYIPGKIWGMIGQVWLTKKSGGISEEKGTIGVALNTVMSILSGLFIFLFLMLFILKDFFPFKVYFLFFLIPFILIALHPKIFVKTINFTLKLLKRAPITFIPRYSQVLQFLILYILFWVSQGVAIFFLIRSFYPVSFSFVFPLCGIFPTASVIGVLSFFTAGGLGVREGVLSYLFSLYMPASIAVIASIIIRIGEVIGEIILFAFFARNLKKYI